MRGSLKLCLWTALALAKLALPAANGGQGGVPEREALLQRHWFEARTYHFHTYSCGPTQDVARLAARLEQFRLAYSSLAGNQAVASPPITVMAFPNHATLMPFLPVYQGKPANLAAFFLRGNDENLIVVSLAEMGTNSLESVYHEYAHLLLRHNERAWPLWMKEGMAEIYSTYQVMGEHHLRIGRPIAHHLFLLHHQELMPLHALLAVTHESPEYNERQRQGIFYAESWLLTHYLMLGDNPYLKSHFGDMTALLRQGQSPEEACTNALHVSLPALEQGLKRYLQAGKLVPLDLTVSADLGAAQALGLRGLPREEVCFRLGDQLLRVGQTNEAEAFFEQGKQIAPASPLPYEGLGLLAAERKQPQQAMRELQAALDRGSTSFLAHYVFAREQFEMSAESPGTYSRFPPAVAGAIRKELEKSLALMPDFGPAHHLLGFLDLLQGDALDAAESSLKDALRLEPDNDGYAFTLAEVQVARMETEAARRTLEPLCRKASTPELKTHALALLKRLER